MFCTHNFTVVLLAMLSIYIYIYYGLHFYETADTCSLLLRSMLAWVIICSGQLAPPRVQPEQQGASASAPSVTYPALP